MAHTTIRAWPLLKVNDIVLDIGANIGTFTVPFAKQVGIGGKVYAFEAMGINFVRLSANIAMNDLDGNVRAANLVIDSTSGNVFELGVVNTNQVDANLGSVNIPESAFALSEARRLYPDVTAVSERVRTQALDDFLFEDDRCPAVIKIDVEGMELQVLEGSSKLLARCRPAVHAENNCVAKSKPLIDFFDRIRYVCYWDVHILPLDIAGRDTPTTTSINMICLPREYVTDADLSPSDEIPDPAVKEVRNYVMMGYIRVDPQRPYLTQYKQFFDIPDLEQSGSLDSCVFSTFNL